MKLIDWLRNFREAQAGAQRDLVASLKWPWSRLVWCVMGIIFDVAVVMFAIGVLLGSQKALAADSWTVLGPAISRHAGKDGAMLSTPDMVENRCNTLFAAPVDPLNGVIQDASVTGCKTTITPGQRIWREFNPALGIERERGKWRDFGMVLADSYGQPGAMAGVAYMPYRHQFHNYRLDAGLAGGLWYRTTIREDRTATGWNCRSSAPTERSCYETTILAVDSVLERKLLPFLMPVISYRPSNGGGFGLYFSAIPKITINGSAVVPVTTYMLQLTYTLDSK